MTYDSIHDYPFSGNSCADNYKRMYTGRQVLELFGQTGLNESKTLVSIINQFLTKYALDIEDRFDSPKLIGKIYSEVNQQILNNQKKSRILQGIAAYEENNQKPPLFSDISKNLGLNELVLIPSLIELYEDGLIALLSTCLPRQKVVTEDPYFQVDITPKGIEFLKNNSF